MIRSMTGFGTADGVVGNSRVSVELRAVNHRFFNPSLKLPSAYQRWEQDVRELLRKRVARGHITVTVRVDRDSGANGLHIDEELLAGFLARLNDISERLDINPVVDVATLLRLPDVITTGSPDPTAGEDPSALLRLVDSALDALSSMREAEGARLAEFLLERLAVVEGAVDRIAVRAPVRLMEHRERMRTSVRELADGAAVDEQRLAQEIAILADRLDVQEELSRFRSHFAAFRETLGRGSPDGVGKRLGFLLQELLREANTTGSKANDAAIQAEVVVIKEELERIREQVENLE